MPKPRKKVRVAIVGTGGMANVHAGRFGAIRGSTVVAACDIDAARASAFAARHNIPAAFGSLDELLHSDGVDAVSVVTPDASHATVTLACLRAGKHVLCEKPLALDAREAAKMLAAARRAGVVHAVNLSYRGWPCIQQAAKLVADGRIGAVRHLEASYLQSWLAGRHWGDWKSTPSWLWRLSTAHGSKGALGDVGVHIIDFASFPVGAIREVFCRLATFPKAPRDRIGDYKLDANDSATLNVVFENGALGVLHATRWAPGFANRLALTISGTLGSIAIDSDISTTGLRICSGADIHELRWQNVQCPPVRDVYQCFVDAIRTGRPAEPDFARGAEVQRVLDAAFESDNLGRPVRLARRSR